MTELRIDRLSATAAADWPAPDEVPGMLRRIAEDRLGRALTEQPLPEGDWCVRRLDVAVDLDPDRPLSALETDWADRIVTALRQSLRDGSRDVVRYLRPEQAVDDLLRGVVTGRFERDWAWRQVGLLEPGDPDPRSDARGVLLVVLGRLRQGPSAALDRLIRRVGLAPVHRLLGREGWTRVAALAVPNVDVDALFDEPVAAPHDRPKHRAARAAAQAALARALADTGTLPAAIRSAGIRADRATILVWALLTIAASDPSLLRRQVADVRGLVREVATRLVPGPSRTVLERALPDRPPRVTSESGVASAEPATDPATPARTASTRAPEDPAVRRGEVDPVRGPRAADGGQVRLEGIDPVDTVEPDPAHTSWGGLAFLLNTAADAGLPEILDEPPFLARPAAWVLRRLGCELVGAAADDPVLLAVAGTDAVLPDAPSDVEQAAITACAARWAAVTAARLRAGGEVDRVRPDAALLRELAHREATIRWEPGWVEVCLGLADVDLEVRRSGLDIDPGWVWWLGQVVRFRYE